MINECLRLRDIFLKKFDIKKLLELDNKYNDNYFYVKTLVFYNKINNDYKLGKEFIENNYKLENEFMKNKYNLNNEGITFYIFYLCYKNKFYDLESISEKFEYDMNNGRIIYYVCKLFETKDENIKLLKQILI